jgi:hypothetical protein
MSAGQSSRVSARTGEKWVMFSPEFSHWDIEARVVSVDGVVMTFEAAGISEPAVALSTRNHGGEGNWKGIGSWRRSF